ADHRLPGGHGRRRARPDRQDHRAEEKVLLLGPTARAARALPAVTPGVLERGHSKFSRIVECPFFPTLVNRLEIVSTADAEPVDPGDGHAGLVAAFQDVVELYFHVRVPEPVQPDRPIVEQSALNVLVVQIEITETGTYLPRSDSRDTFAAGHP